MVLNVWQQLKSVFDRSRFWAESFFNRSLIEAAWFFEKHRVKIGRLDRWECPFFLNEMADIGKSPAGQSASADSFADIIRKADKICDHVFDILGTGDMKAGPQINWHSDFKNKYSWDPGQFYRTVEIPYDKADIKMPWELSRFQHLVTLGQAYRLTGDEKYSVEFVSQTRDWILRNPFMFGVNWRCAMEVAVRAANLIAAFFYFRSSLGISRDFWALYLKSLYQHGCHLKNNLEAKVRQSNHYLADIAGLIFLGTFFDGMILPGFWKKFGLKELVCLMEEQVHPDGCDHEASTCYHRLVLELFFFSVLISVRSRDEFDGANYRELADNIFGPAFINKLYKMFDAVCYLLKPNGRMPQIGDNDSGQFLKFYPRDALDMRYLLALGAVFFREPKWKIREFFTSVNSTAEIFLVFGEQGERIWNSLAWSSLGEVGSKAFSYAGWYVMRRNRNYCVISCPARNCGEHYTHGHDDDLSFELFFEGNDLLVDPGTCLYTSDVALRNRFRSSGCHNTVRIDNADSFRSDAGSLFRMRGCAVSKCLDWKAERFPFVFIGERYVGEGSSAVVVHRRTLIFDGPKKAFKVKDQFEGMGSHAFEWNFILLPECSDRIVIQSDGLEFQKTPDSYSPAYGVMKQSVRVTAKKNVDLPAEKEILIELSVGIDSKCDGTA